ncbi:hypothetical protein [Roseivirga sp. E12]|uniref:hypothetical protein n=1 Tax=Roseivirga sp. E12 TaxID=2819237 RepID=UPI001ABC46DB|nr:hypothetical protein [Roseivirga sp. E12]MBO3699875.1 hypothetical protein [Roseivirga sp. E12]
MKNLLKALFIITMFAFSTTLNGQSETNYYKLKTCTGIDPEGNTFDGAMCKDIVEDGPCDKESICYGPDDVIPYE